MAAPARLADPTPPAASAGLEMPAEQQQPPHKGHHHIFNSQISSANTKRFSQVLKPHDTSVFIPLFIFNEMQTTLNA